MCKAPHFHQLDCKVRDSLHMTVKNYFLVTLPGTMPVWSTGMAGNVTFVNDV